MQIMIEIDDNLYTRLFDNGEDYAADMRRACVTIRKGVVLPKGHGRLIDAELLLNEISDLSTEPMADLRLRLRNAPTIIEADKENNDADND